jgi:Fe-S-cluster containining protein
MVMLNPCSGCNARCCSDYIVTVTSFDVLRISKKTAMEPEEFAQFYPATILNLDWDSVLQFHTGSEIPDYCILALKSRPCFFLEDKRCKIHEFAPSICSRYPFGRGGSMNARHCSILARALFLVNGPQSPKIMDEIRTYHKIVKEWNDSKGKKESAMQFLMSKSADFKEYPD